MEDLNLLQVFATLWHERSASKAASKLAIGQPAVSARLSKLREAFQDPLFVRHARGLTPTPRAEELAPQILAALEGCAAAFRSPGAFDPAKAEGRLVIAGTDYFDLFALPTLVPYLAEKAPGVQLVTKSVRSKLAAQEMQEGSIDLTIAGFIRDLPEGFYRQTILDETYASIVRKDHPQIKDELTLEQFVTIPHLLISPDGDMRGSVDEVLAAQNLSRRIIAGVGNFHAPGAIIANSDLILTAPRRLAESFAAYLPVKILQPPIEVPGFDIIQVWHERTRHDPLRVWLRSLVQRFCAGESLT